MNYSIEVWLHSADKDHRIMTWWTLTVDKTVRCESWVTFYTYSIPMYSWVFDENFHKWIHCAEHLIAYKKDTGSVRDSLEEVTRWETDGKVILDISPYKTSVDTFWFRITSMVPLPVEQVRELLEISISRAIDFLEAWEVEDKEDFQWIPFARDIACWQFDFHDKQRAINDLKKVQVEDLEIQEREIASKQKTAYVCDLRFLKPKIKWSEWMVMFSPDFSYRLSLLIEKKLPNKLPGSIVLVGTFGCMTGMYLCVSSEIWDHIDIQYIHWAIIEVIQENIQKDTLDWPERIQLETLLKNYSANSL